MSSQQVVAGVNYFFDLVLKPVFVPDPMGRYPPPPCFGVPPPAVERCHVEVFEGLTLDGIEGQREVTKTNCPREDQQQDYSDQGEYCIYHNN